MSDDLQQRREDQAVGRALRLARAAGPSTPRVHVTWTTEAGRTSGRYLSDEPLYTERYHFAEAADDLYCAAAEYVEGA